jgi:anti-anti-sigma regulatory factor
VAAIGATRRVFTQLAEAPPDAPAASAVWLRPTVDLDFATEADGAAELATRCGAEGDSQWIIVQGSSEWFVDVRGLAALLRGAERARRYGRGLVVLEPPWSLNTIVVALKIESQLRLLHTRAELVLLDVPTAR